MVNVETCVTVLKELRNDDELFHSLFTNVSSTLGEEIQMPRRASTQKNRSNIPAETAEIYFKRSVFLPLLDSCIAQMKERFNKHCLLPTKICNFLPSSISENRDYPINEIVEMYQEQLDVENSSYVTATIEFQRWKACWLAVAKEKRPCTALHACKAVGELGTYPIIHKLLRIFLTLPVTTASNERCFSSLKYLKNYLRSSMTERRLGDLAQLYLNKDILLNYDTIIDKFAKVHRRIKL